MVTGRSAGTNGFTAVGRTFWVMKASAQSRTLTGFASCAVAELGYQAALCNFGSTVENVGVPFCCTAVGGGVVDSGSLRPAAHPMIWTLCTVSSARHALFKWLYFSQHGRGISRLHTGM